MAKTIKERNLEERIQEFLNLLKKNKEIKTRLKKKNLISAWLDWTIEIRMFTENLRGFVYMFKDINEDKKQQIDILVNEAKSIIIEVEKKFIGLDREWTKEEEKKIKEYAKKLESINKGLDKYRPKEH